MVQFSTGVALEHEIQHALYNVLLAIAGGGLLYHKLDDWHQRLWQLACTTTTIDQRQRAELRDRPWDIYIRTAPALFKRYGKNELAFQSNWGLERTVLSPLELARLLLVELEQHLTTGWHCRVDECSSFVCLLSPTRARHVLAAGMKCCSACPAWFDTEKGRGWHQLVKHGISYDVVAQEHVQTRLGTALVVYNSNAREMLTAEESATCQLTKLSRNLSSDEDGAFALVKAGNLIALQALVEQRRHPLEHWATLVDHRGASLLLWAAGGGQVDMVRYLHDTLQCDVHFAQRGRRAFAGRTALHWASRQGRLVVVQYLLEQCAVDVNQPTQDGTTAFCWAAWQGHQPVLTYLLQHGADATTQNCYSCNAALWAAQGHGDVAVLQWLDEVAGCSVRVVNANGHGVLHKAAQRGQHNVCDWMMQTILVVLEDVASCETLDVKVDVALRTVWDMIGPDTEGWMPSDLAGAEEHEELAKCLRCFELDLAQQLVKCGRHCIPDWLQTETCVRKGDVAWGAWAGAERLRCVLAVGREGFPLH